MQSCLSYIWSLRLTSRTTFCFLFFMVLKKTGEGVPVGVAIKTPIPSPLYPSAPKKDRGLVEAYLWWCMTREKTAVSPSTVFDLIFCLGMCIWEPVTDTHWPQYKSNWTKFYGLCYTEGQTRSNANVWPLKIYECVYVCNMQYGYCSLMVKPYWRL